jgi:pyrroloquinoline quinone biosynthesis protein D
VIGARSAPRLSPSVRLRFDRVSGRTLLMCPERGMVLNESALAILELCTGEHSVSDMIERLLSTHGGQRAVIERDVLTFLRELERRRLVIAAPAKDAS